MFRAPLPFLGAFGPGTEPTSLPTLSLPVTASQVGVCVIVSDPLMLTSRRGYIETLVTIDSYSHQTKAIGGFFSAEIGFKSRVGDISQWLLRGIGRHIEVFDQAQGKIWEGLVNQIVITVGGLEYTIGPLLGADVTNKTRTSYSAIDYSIYPPATGINLKTAYATNSNSQGRFGLLERTLEVNEVTENVARYIRDNWIGIHAFPKISVRPSFSESSDVTIVLSCVGYWQYLEAYTYASTTTGGAAISTKIISVLNANPNLSIFSTDYSYITSNTIEIKAQEDNSRTGAAILSEAATYGDINGVRYNIGIYEDRKLYYQPSPSTISYYKYFDSRVTSLQGSILQPWNVFPGRWIFHSGFLFAEGIPNTFAGLASSDSVGYIEGITFTAPFGLDIETVRVRGIDQFLSRLGIGSL